MKLEPLKKNCFYHIYNRGNNGDAIFKNNDNYQYFLRLFNKYLTAKVSVFAYCLLKNHYHLLIRVEEENVTQSFSNFFNAYAKAFNKAPQRTDSLFEKHFKRIQLQSETYIKQLVLYIHTNPQHHKITEDFREYPYSAYQILTSDKKTTIKRNPVIDLFEGIENFKFTHMQKREALTQKYTLA